MAQRRPLSPKEVKYIEAKVEGKSNTEAAMIATGAKTKDVAKTQGYRLSTNVNVQEELAKAFKRHGIDIDAATKPIADGLKADKVHIVGNGDQAMAEIVPDHSVRLKAAGMAFNLMGVGRQAGDVSISFIVHAKEQQQIYDL